MRKRVRFRTVAGNNFVSHLRLIRNLIRAVGNVQTRLIAVFLIWRVQYFRWRNQTVSGPSPNRLSHEAETTFSQRAFRSSAKAAFFSASAFRSATRSLPHPRHWPSVVQEGRAPLHESVGVVETLMQRLDWHENFTLHGTQHARCSSLASKASRCRSRLRVDSSSCRTTILIRGRSPWLQQAAICGGCIQSDCLRRRL